MEEQLTAEAVPPPPAPPAPAVTERFHFTGKAGEYFGIWIVNLFLTIVTLGIYSAWAKVRKKRYYYGNTWLAGSNFEYHGNPVAILKGRIIAFGAFAAYSAGAHFSPHTAAIVAIVLMPAVPWLLVRSFAFNAVNSSYRNLRFHFRATYTQALVALAPAALVPIATLVLPELDPETRKPDAMFFVTAFTPLVVFWLVYPYLVAKVRLLRINNSRYGTAPFSNPLGIGSFYWIYIKATLLFIVTLAVFVGIGAAIGYTLRSAAMILLPLVPLMYIATFVLLFGFTQSRVTNLVFNHTTLDARVSLRSSLRARKLAWLFATNVVASIFTLGLLIPWAAMRNARYRAECLEADCPGGLETFLGDVAIQVSATGEEMGEMFDIDFSL